MAQAQDTLSTRQRKMREVVVTTQRSAERIGKIQIGAEQVNISELTATPQLFGERDIMRSLQLLPGVKSESDASSNFQVRGGTSAQNLILIDDAPVYNLGHLAGLFSAFNDNALASATLYKGLIPAQYGGASSAVFSTTARTGTLDNWHGSATIGLLAAKAMVEGPLVQQKMSLLVTARRSYMDALLQCFPDFRGNTLYFYDLNAKLHYAHDTRNSFSLTFFRGRDRTALEDKLDMGWSNRALSLSWRHLFSGSALSHTTALYSDYSTDNAMDILGMDASFTGHIRQGGLRQSFQFHWGPAQFHVGIQSLLMDVKSAEWHEMNVHERESRTSWDNAFWVNTVAAVTDQLSLSAGLRTDAFSVLGGAMYYDLNEQGDIIRLFNKKRGEIVKTYVNLEPRLSANWRMHPLMSLKAGYCRTTQHLHALRNQSLATPFDRYITSSNLLHPEVADQVSLGFFAMTPAQDYDISLEGYYRDIQHVLDYRDGKSFSSEIELERLVLAGQGRGYGAEFCLRKNSGRLTGWLAYTLSWSQAKIPGINEGRWYDANNDRRHDINAVANYHLSPRWTLGAAWTYNSGQAFTAPSGKYVIEDNYIYYYSERNGYRAPDYHRLDISATWTKQVRRLHHELNFSIYNLYNRYNPFIINFEDSENGARTRAKQYSLFGIMPSVAYTLRF